MIEMCLPELLEQKRT